MKFLVLNGVNLNLTGKREKGVYGSETLESINCELEEDCEKQGHKVDFFQSNLEGEICTKIQEAEGNYDGIVLNAGAFTHYSFAIRDAIAAISVPADGKMVKDASFELHKGEILGFGKKSYLLALRSFTL